MFYIINEQDIATKGFLLYSKTGNAFTIERVQGLSDKCSFANEHEAITDFISHIPPDQQCGVTLVGIMAAANQIAKNTFRGQANYILVHSTMREKFSDLITIKVVVNDNLVNDTECIVFYQNQKHAYDSLGCIVQYDDGHVDRYLTTHPHRYVARLTITS